MNRLAQWKADKTYRAKQNLLAHTHEAIAPELEAMRRADDLLDRCVRSSHEKQGYVNEPDCSRIEIHTMRPCSQFSDLATENEPVGACFLAGMDKGEDSTRNVATCNV